ncbi:MAG: hypothetical protein A2898_03345 [Candidatus Kerfeldbacteria bacterium RIFCSPLOWO2_01_FULL_48_11]|uniref:Phosphatidic acid phosphatase type 2/haloperoxidase domain-containing protein n=1 Tax=Candidatus Kerfeldbacteria bacterium RIFCSPLOWO2_01_FULL_48_11 TaxID=1798543 RepID=A0A1G2B514_9BACT|nr:MAG: hypothetical protein UY34_C0009G0016 [Parcubacteria group bacterium GW2011_GWA2_48_9]KKW16773.1 MAG: hypothetical protein UY52_C0001G0093 [Parcubacteria group bacterium GW2011_GWC2_49_9]OGY83300.1 MAG: hypothetical protein A2898_03345 [Candidatus Kerfeldbacteria bacterium RIFCSPLOWO2_01_FULL_48_11]HCJ52247.1 hypothetical protein [Candidatus Kerfeldbacteria bacterium]
MEHRAREHWHHILIAGTITVAGLLLFKYIPMWIWGNDILFDASGHMSLAIFALYVMWFFIDQNKKWRIPYFFFATLILAIIAIHRIITNAHNDVGLLLGLALGMLAIGISHWKEVKKRLEF